MESIFYSMLADYVYIALTGRGYTEVRLQPALLCTLGKTMSCQSKCSTLPSPVRWRKKHCTNIYILYVQTNLCSTKDKTQTPIGWRDWPQTSVSAIPAVWLVQSPAQRESPNMSWSCWVFAGATEERRDEVTHDTEDVSTPLVLWFGDGIYLHDLNEFEKQLLSVLSFLLLDYYRAHPNGQEDEQTLVFILNVTYTVS